MFRLGTEFKHEKLLKPHINTGQPHRHDVIKLTNKEDGSTYILKEIQKDDIPVHEVVAQEILRALIPSQPAYYLVIMDNYDISAVISEFIAGRALADGQEAKELRIGTSKNLGKIQMGCLFVEDTDLRLANMIKKDDELYKIDGDWAFSSLKRPDLFKENVVSAHIQKLPFIHDDSNSFTAHNWIDHRSNGESKPEHKLPHLSKIKEDKDFQTEVYQTFLRILLLPDSVIKKIVDEHTIRIKDKKNLLSSTITSQDILIIRERDKAVRKILLNKLINKRDSFFPIGLKNKKFIEFVMQTGIKETKIFIKELKKYQINKKFILKSDVQDIKLRWQLMLASSHVAVHGENIQNEMHLFLHKKSKKIKHRLDKIMKAKVNDIAFDETISLPEKKERIEEAMKLIFEPKTAKKKFLKYSSLMSLFEQIHRIPDSKRSVEINYSISILKKWENNNAGNVTRFFKSLKIVKPSDTEKMLTKIQTDLTTQYRQVINS